MATDELSSPDSTGEMEGLSLIEEVLMKESCYTAVLAQAASNLAQAISGKILDAESYRMLEAVRGLQEQGKANDVLAAIHCVKFLDGWKSARDNLQSKFEAAQQAGVDVGADRELYKQINDPSHQLQRLADAIEQREQDPIFKSIIRARGEVRARVGEILLLEERAKQEVEQFPMMDQLTSALVDLQPKSREYLADYFDRKSGAGVEAEDAQENEKMQQQVARLLELAEDLGQEFVDGNFTGGDLVARQIFYFLAALDKGDYKDAVYSLDNYGSFFKQDDKKYEAEAQRLAELLVSFKAYLDKSQPQRYTGVMNQLIGRESEDFKAWQDEGLQLRHNNLFKISLIVRVPEGIRAAMNLSNMQPYLAQCVGIYGKLVKVCRILQSPGDPCFTRLREHLSKLKYGQVAHELRSDPKDGWSEFLNKN